LIFSLRAAGRALQKYQGWLALFFGAACNVALPSFTENAVANGETRTINLYHVHTQESISAAYLVNGRYDSAVLKQLNWFLRDWRRDEPTEMDPRLFDVIWETYRTAGAGDEVVRVVSAYRSPETNAMLRARSRKVAEFSQHMLGKAMDTTMPGMPMSRIREIGMRMQRGGVGYYPTANTPFVHLDVGNVRAWPRMTYDQLVRLFPDGKTVHLPSNGQPLARYDEAKAEIEARNNGAIVMALPKQTGFGGFLASLFGGGGGEDDSEEVAEVKDSRKQWAELAPRMSRAARRKMLESDEEAPPDPAVQRGRAQIARAEVNLPRGETVLQPGPEDIQPAAQAAADEKARVAMDKAAERERAAIAEREKQAAEREMAALIDAPLPPAGRPSSIDKPAPLDEKRAASLEEPGEGKARRGKLAEAEEAAPDARVLAAPLPPRRPKSLDRLAVARETPAKDKDRPETGEKLAHAPMPPTRPKTFAVAAPATVNAPLPAPRPKRLGTTGRDAAQALDSIVEPTGSVAKRDDGKAAVAARDNEPLAFAAAPKKPGAVADVAAQKPAVAPTQLDRSNYGAMTSVTPTGKAIDATVTGGSVASLRKAARAGGDSPLAAPSGMAAKGFDEPATPTAPTGFVKN